MNFQDVFHTSPESQASAPGRVNLLGEHTDYNDGFVLPTAIPQQTTVQVSISDAGHHQLYSDNLHSRVDLLDGHHTPSGFAKYIFGCLEVLVAAGHTIPSLNIYVRSSVPMGSGLSSSAALEVATLRAIRQLLDLPIDDVELAQLAQQAEIHYAGVQCGIMDQMASSLADTQHLLFLDTRSLERRILPFPDGTQIVAIDSGVPRMLAASGYNQRRAECQEAAHLLGVNALRDIGDPRATDALPEPLNRRARHVITENNRVLEVVRGVTPDRFGKLMNDSHASLRDDYQVSIPALDNLVELLQETPGVLGARLTGAGFGGACVALVDVGKETEIAHRVLDRYRQRGFDGKILVPDVEVSRAA